MAITHGAATRTALANQIKTALDAGPAAGRLKVYAGATLLADYALAKPCGTVAGAVLTFAAVADVTAAASGTPTRFDACDSTGAVIFSGTVGATGSGADLEAEIPGGGWLAGGTAKGPTGTYTAPA